MAANFVGFATSSDEISRMGPLRNQARTGLLLLGETRSNSLYEGRKVGRGYSERRRLRFGPGGLGPSSLPGKNSRKANPESLPHPKLYP